jgi:hypothetical protein
MMDLGATAAIIHMLALWMILTLIVGGAILKEWCFVAAGVCGAGGRMIGTGLIELAYCINPELVGDPWMVFVYLFFGITSFVSGVLYIRRRLRWRKIKWEWQADDLKMQFEFKVPPGMDVSLFEIPQKPEESIKRRPGESEKKYKKRMK